MSAGVVCIDRTHAKDRKMSFDDSESLHVADYSVMYELRVVWNIVQIVCYFAALAFALRHAAQSAAPARRTRTGCALLLAVSGEWRAACTMRVD